MAGRAAGGRQPPFPPSRLLLLLLLQVDAELRGMETASVKDYVQEADAIAALYGQVESCEAVLGEMQGLLAGFQARKEEEEGCLCVPSPPTRLLSPPPPIVRLQENLGGISAEIRQLQAQSLEMSIKMANRKRLAGKVMGFLRKASDGGGEEGRGEGRCSTPRPCPPLRRLQVAVPEPLIASITDAPLDDAWLRDLAALSDKLHFTSGQQKGRPPPTSSTAAEAGGAAAGAAAAAAEADDLSDLSVDPFRTPAGKDALPQASGSRR